jgi:DNA mismatch repair protein MutS2
LPISPFVSITADVQLVRKEGYVLEIESIRNIYRIVSIGLELTKYFQEPEKAKFNPLLNELVANIIIDKSLTTEIDRVLDEEGDVRPNASEELLKISKQIKSKERELDRCLMTNWNHIKIRVIWWIHSKAFEMEDVYLR